MLFIGALYVLFLSSEIVFLSYEEVVDSFSSLIEKESDKGSFGVVEMVLAGIEGDAEDEDGIVDKFG